MKDGGGGLKARIWLTDGHDRYPEFETDLPGRTANTGVCLSGGGTRAMVAGIGQLRALWALGLQTRIRYISAVSGGTWASGPLLFSDRDEAALFGPMAAPETLTLDALGALSTDTLGHLATLSLRSRLWDLLGHAPEDRLWIDGVGEQFLTPLGLFDRAHTAYYAADRAGADAIATRNPGLGRTIDTPRTERPFWIANGCIIGPKSMTPLKRESPVGIEFTPMYTGSPRRMSVTFYDQDGKGRKATVGGGYIEPFAFGGAAPDTVDDGIVSVPSPTHPWCLADAIGVSSSAFAGYAEQNHLIDAITGLAPQSPLWSMPPDAPAEPFALGDGGVLENYGIIPLIRRGVERIVVFVNTAVRLAPTFEASRESQWDGIDRYLPALFGYRVVGTGIALQNNHVFEQGLFQSVVDGLVAARAGGGGIVHRSKLTLVDNDWWGIAGGGTVDVTWVYNDRVADWEARLPEETRHAIDKGNHSTFFHGPLESFPTYATAGQNGLEIVELTPIQVNALAQLTSWTVMNHADLFRDALG